jgi:putative heme iron utilization protein
MTNAAKPSLEDILSEALEFYRAFDSLLLATADREGHPHASYAVHIADDQGRFYIYISELAAHTQNLHQKPRASVLLIEDENRAKHLFGRKRLTCDCRAEPISRNTAAWQETMGLFVDKHGKFMEMLQGLEDFHLFRLIPEKAIYVRGFAQAFELSGDQLGAIRPINDKGHRPVDTETAEAMNSAA